MGTLLTNDTIRQSTEKADFRIKIYNFSVFSITYRCSLLGQSERIDKLNIQLRKAIFDKQQRGMKNFNEYFDNQPINCRLGRTEKGSRP